MKRKPIDRDDSSQSTSPSASLFPLALPAPASAMTIIDEHLIDQALVASRQSPRGRIILPLHKSHADVLHRMLNAMQPGSYVRPHRHLNPPKAETVILLRGSIGYLSFEESGQVIDRVVLTAQSGRIGIDTEPGVFHTFFALEPDTVLFEIKPGPYERATDKDFAPWAPAEGAPEAVEYLEQMRALSLSR